jgi:hypothetical protein
VGRSLTVLHKGIGECAFLITSVSEPPVDAPDTSRWHHAHVVDPVEKRELARRRKLRVSRREQGSGAPLLGGVD